MSRTAPGLGCEDEGRSFKKQKTYSYSLLGIAILPDWLIMGNLTIKSMGLSINQTSHLTELTEPEAQLSIHQNKLTVKEDKMLSKKSAQMQCPREQGPSTGQLRESRSHLPAPNTPTHQPQHNRGRNTERAHVENARVAQKSLV